MTEPKIDYGYLSVQDFERMIALMDGKDEMYAVMFSIMRYRGYEPIAVCNLKLEDITDDFELKYFRPKTNHGSIAKTPEVVKYRLRNWIEANRTRMFNGFVFGVQNSHYGHVQPGTLTKKFRCYVKRVIPKIPFDIDTNKKLLNAGRKRYYLRLYDLRGSFATDVYVATRCPKTTAYMLNHGDMKSVNKYIRRAIISLGQQSTLDKVYGTSNIPEGNIQTLIAAPNIMTTLT